LLSVANASRAEQLPIKSYTTADGLIREYIDCIVPDSHGFLWFCTPEGLSQFDGYNFVNYGPEQGLPQAAILTLLEGRDGTYWVGTSNGVCRFDLFATKNNQGPNSQAFGILASSPKFVCYNPGGRRRVNAIKEDRNGVFWFGTNNGLFQLQQSKNRLEFIHTEIGLPSTPENAPFISTMLLDRSGSLWIGTGSGLYRRLPDGRTEHYTTANGLSDNDVRTLLEDSNGAIWVGTSHGLCELVSQPAPHTSVVAYVYTVSTGLANDFITALYQSENGKIWVGTDGGLIEFVPSQSNVARKFQTYITKQGLSGNEIRSLGEDIDGNLWIGTESSGAMKLVQNGLVTYTEDDGLEDTRIASVFEDVSGHLCALSSRLGKVLMHRFDGTSFVAIHPNLPADTKRSWGWNQVAFQDHAKEWWIDTTAGLYRFPVSNGIEELAKLSPSAVYTKKDGLSGNEIFRLYEDRSGDIWMSIFSEQASLTRWERATRKFYQYGGIEALPQDSGPTAFCEDGAGDLWIGLYHGELVRYRSGIFTRFTIADGVRIGIINDLFVDHRGKIWIATGHNGLAMVEDANAERPQFTTFTTSQGLASNQVNCVTEDKQGLIYIGTAKGIDRLDPSTGQIKHYSKADGLANNYVNVAHRDRQGALWFGTLQGLSRLIPEADRAVSPPTILISKVRIGGVEQTLSDLADTNLPVLVLEPGRNQIQIDFVGLSYRAGETLYYQTRLEGADKTWSEPSLQRMVNYAQIAPGTYRFLVRAVTTDGTLSIRPAVISFRILPPIWQRWWFLTLVGFFVAGLVYVAYRYRINQLLELERVRTRIATDLHDDIGSSLSQIAILSEVARNRVSRLHDGSDKELSLIARISRESVDAMSDIVWAINPQRDWLGDLVGRMRRFAGEIFPARGIEFKFTTNMPEQDTRLTTDLRRQIFLIFKECVNNIVRHSECTRVSIALSLEGGWLVMKLCDNGKGFDPATATSGHGLKSMKVRAKKLGGELQIGTNDLGGTVVTVRVPLATHVLRWPRLPSSGVKCL
jgi:ligand-binding sensor domain-containing protein/two-component sensor histidine kinase